ncbi:hypothetical protein MBLNU457_2286t2 [Dothideomycetes sp. NU457]
MPTYLVHGFRWPRPLIRIHIILQNLDDAAAEWLVAPGTTATLLENLEELYPELTSNLPDLRFIEQYDPSDMSVVSQPYAYVADIVHEIRLGLDIDEVRGKGVSNEQWGSMMELRDKLAPEEKVGWYVVVCGDELRSAPSFDESVENGGYTHNVPYTPPMQNIPYRPQTSDSRSVKTSTETKSTRTVSRTNSTEQGRNNLSSPEMPEKGFRKFVGVLTRRKSRQSMRDLQSSGSNNSLEPAPPVPALPPGVRMSS